MKNSKPNKSTTIKLEITESENNRFDLKISEYPTGMTRDDVIVWKPDGSFGDQTTLMNNINVLFGLMPFIQSMRKEKCAKQTFYLNGIPSMG